MSIRTRLALGISLVAFVQLLGLPAAERAFDVEVAEWIPAIPLQLGDGSIGSFRAAWSFRLDPLSGLMILVVTGIGTLIHVYSTAYMADEPRAGVGRLRARGRRRQGRERDTEREARARRHLRRSAIVCVTAHRSSAANRASERRRSRRPRARRS